MKNKIVLSISIASVVFITGCSPSLTKPEIADINNTSEVLVYRDFSFNTLSTKVYFGENDKKYLKLGNNDYGIVQMPSGEHELNVGTPNKPYKIFVNLENGQRTCFKTAPKLSNIFLGGVVYFMRSLFTLEEVSCPTDDALGKMDKVN